MTQSNCTPHRLLLPPRPAQVALPGLVSAMILLCSNREGPLLGEDRKPKSRDRHHGREGVGESGGSFSFFIVPP